MSSPIELEEFEAERISYETNEIKDKIMMKYAVNLVDYFRSLHPNGEFMIDILSEFLISDEELDDIESVNISFVNNKIYMHQLFNHKQGLHILENMRVCASDDSYITLFLSNLVTKFGYNLEYPVNYNIMVATKSYNYICNSMINGKLLFKRVDKID
jgi:hypothetical protein